MKPKTVMASILWMMSAAASAQTLNILVYDYANLTSEQTASMQEIGGRLLEKTGISASWTVCRGAAATPETANSCQRELGSHDLVVCLRQTEASKARPNSVPLAYAMVSTQGGKYASLLWDAVQSEAKEKQISSSMLLGYSVVHEIGHCLLGPQHSPAGMMRAGWTRRDARDMDQMRLMFSRSEAQKIRARLR